MQVFLDSIIGYLLEMTNYIFIFISIFVYAMIYLRKNDMQSMLAVPFTIITVLYFGSIVGIFYWIFYTNRSYNDFVLFLTLIILVFYTYYTLQVVKSTYSGPALLQVQMSHSETLKLFLRKWLEELKELPNSENIPYNSATKWINKFNTLEERWQYRDLLDHHLPENYKDLQDDWYGLKDLIIDLESESNKLIELIYEEIDKQLDDIKRINPNVSFGKDEDIKYFVVRIYKLCISKYPECYSEDINIEVKKQQENSYQIMISHVGILFNGSKDQMEQAKFGFEKIAECSYIRNKYMDNIERIETHNMRLKNKRDELQRKIEDLITWTLLPGTSCDRLKDFKVKL